MRYKGDVYSSLIYQKSRRRRLILLELEELDELSKKRVMMDVLFYKKPSRIDRLSKQRGLHLTLDGIHLNSSGARIVADVYASKIDQLIYKNKEAIQL